MAELSGASRADDAPCPDAARPCDRPSARARDVRAAAARLRHPVRSMRAFLDTCSVKSAFAFYALAGTAAALAASMAAVSALSSVSEDLLSRKGVDPGLYIYDGESDALVKAEDMSWYAADDGEFVNYAEGDEAIVVRGTSLYVASRSSKDGRAAIPLDGSSDVVDEIAVHDIDERPYDEAGTSIAPADVPAYDATANAQRGDAAGLRALLPADSEGVRPAVSLVGYYVYLPSGPLYQAVNLAVFAAVPAIFAVCFLAAGRGFYARKLQRPVRVMEEAARRIAEGDLSVPVPAPPAHSNSELDRLCASFETMRDALERSTRSAWRLAENRRRANAAFAHDLRTPLTVLKGRVEMLASCADGAPCDSARLAEASSAIGRSAERLQRYVESMKVLADVDDYAPDAREGDPGAWFVQVVAEASELARTAGKGLEAQAGGLPPRAVFDEVALSRVVENALANALRYARSRAMLSCAWNDGVLTLRIADDGPGFGRAALEHGCEPFWRDAAEKGREDSVHFGLGLNICAELCGEHGGGVRLSNAVEGGAVVEAFVRAPAVQAGASG